MHLTVTFAHYCAVCNSKRLETARVSSIQGCQLLMLAHLIRWNKKEVVLNSWYGRAPRLPAKGRNLGAEQCAEDPTPGGSLRDCWRVCPGRGVRCGWDRRSSRTFCHLTVSSQAWGRVLKSTWERSSAESVVWLMLCNMIGIQTGGGFEKETKRIQEI